MKIIVKVLSYTAAILIAAGFTPSPAWTQSFSLADLGTLGGGSSVAAAVNVRNQVAGWSTTESGETHAFLHDGTLMRDLGTLGGSASAAAALNDAGLVAGWSTTTSGETHAFLHDGALMRDLGTLGGVTSAAVAVNASGQVAGWSTTASGATHAFFHDGIFLHDLGTFGGDASAATALNDAGQVVGWANDATGESHAFLFDGTLLRDLGTLDGYASESLDVNAAGQVVGRYWVQSSRPGDGRITRAFLFDGTKMRDLGTLGGDSSEAVAINDAGQAVGSADLAAGYLDTHAVLFNGTAIFDLGTLGGEESEAVGINALGQVLGIGDMAEGTAYRWMLWSCGEVIDLESLIFAAGYTGVENHTLHLGDGGAIAGSALTAAGESHAFLMSPVGDLRLALDVRPASPAGSVNPDSRGIVQVALLSQPGLPAGHLVDRASLTFGRGGSEDSLLSCLPVSHDVNGDNLKDLVCHFSMVRAGFVPGDTTASLAGKLTDGRPFTAAGSLRSVPR